MGGEGSMSNANQSLKYNRGQLNRKTFKDLKDLMRSQSGKTVVEFEKISPEELFFIKEEIRRKAKKEQKKLVIAITISIIITSILVFLIFSYT